MKTENILIIGGLAFLAYWLLKKNKIVEELKPKELKATSEIGSEQVKAEPKSNPNSKKTVFINLSLKEKPRTSMSKSFYEDFFGEGFDTSKFGTIAPPKTTVQNRF